MHTETEDNAFMETMTIRYNPANDFVLSLINLLRKTKAIKIVSDSGVTYEPNAETLEAIEDVKNGRVYHASGTEDLFKQILG